MDGVKVPGMLRCDPLAHNPEGERTLHPFLAVVETGM
jgi:hypothetical protein